MILARLAKQAGLPDGVLQVNRRINTVGSKFDAVLHIFMSLLICLFMPVSMALFTYVRFCALFHVLFPNAV